MTQLIKKLSEPKTLLILAVLYTLLITIAFLFPAVDLPNANIRGFDKIIHALIHGVLSFIWLSYILSADKYHISIRIVVVVLIMCFLYGLLIEASQHWFTLSRRFDLLDILANTIGSLMGLLFFRFFRKMNFQ